MATSMVSFDMCSRYKMQGSITCCAYYYYCEGMFGIVGLLVLIYVVIIENAASSSTGGLCLVAACANLWFVWNICSNIRRSDKILFLLVHGIRI